MKKYLRGKQKKMLKIVLHYLRVWRAGEAKKNGGFCPHRSVFYGNKLSKIESEIGTVEKCIIVI